MERALRKHVADFGDDLRQEDIAKLMFLKGIPRGIRERLTNPVEVFEHLEEMAKLDFEDPFTVIEMMRDIHKEKWALDTERIFGIHRSSRLIVNWKMQKSEEECGNIEPDSPVIRREQPSPETKLSNSLKRLVKLHDTQLPIQEQLTTSSCYPPTELTICSTPSLNSNNDCIEVNQHREHGTPTAIDAKTSQHIIPSTVKSHSKLTRNPSSASHRSSGYVSGEDDENDEEMTEQEYYQQHMCLLGSTSINSRSSTLGSGSSGSHDGYITAEDDDEDKRLNDADCMQQESILLPNSPGHRTNIYSPPHRGVQKIEGDMEITVKDLQRTVEKSTFGQVYQSYSFPSFCGSDQGGVQFQIHLYPISLRSASSPACAVYLVVLGWKRAIQPLPKFEINVSIIQKASQGKTTVLRSEQAKVNVMTDSIPPTPSDVDYINIALFPSIIPHSDLFKLEGRTIIVKATLEYVPPVS